MVLLLSVHPSPLPSFPPSFPPPSPLHPSLPPSLHLLSPSSVYLYRYVLSVLCPSTIAYQPRLLHPAGRETATPPPEEVGTRGGTHLQPVRSLCLPAAIHHFIVYLTSTGKVSVQDYDVNLPGSCGSVRTSGACSGLDHVSEDVLWDVGTVHFSKWVHGRLSS